MGEGWDREAKRLAEHSKLGWHTDHSAQGAWLDTKDLKPLQQGNNELEPFQIAQSYQQKCWHKLSANLT